MSSYAQGRVVAGEIEEESDSEGEFDEEGVYPAGAGTVGDSGSSRSGSSYRTPTTAPSAAQDLRSDVSSPVPEVHHMSRLSNVATEMRAGFQPPPSRYTVSMPNEQPQLAKRCKKLHATTAHNSKQWVQNVGKAVHQSNTASNRSVVSMQDVSKAMRKSKEELKELVLGLEHLGTDVGLHFKSMATS
eukprot:GFYU01003887.1.p1 GENE.GFYU01003887.1~~GFYU01003887.1.p1  ORF type:complete len:187 (+),score=24.53 GFYU01003887.1:86-646(+)